MSARELVVLGTASQAPTRSRSHVAAFLRFDDVGLLLDCGEGTQRQLLHAGVPASRVDRICITHAHGDHCLGLPGVLSRMVLDGLPGPVPLHCPASAVDGLSRLTGFATDGGPFAVDWQPADEAAGQVAATGPGWRLETAPLAHRVPTVGYRLVEDDGVRLLPERLAQAGVRGPDVGTLVREGSLGRVRLADVSAPRPGQKVAFVMDTELSDGAYALADGADLLAVEATFLHRDAALAREHRHLTGRQAARLATECGVRRVVLLHVSRRYPDPAELAAEAGEEHGDVVVAEDLDVVAVPPRA